MTAIPPSAETAALIVAKGLPRVPSPAPAPARTNNPHDGSTGWPSVTVQLSEPPDEVEAAVEASVDVVLATVVDASLELWEVVLAWVELDVDPDDELVDVAFAPPAPPVPGVGELEQPIAAKLATSADAMK